MRASAACLFLECSHTDSVFPILIGAYAMARGTVSLAELSSEVLLHFPNMPSGFRVVTRIPHYDCMLKTDRRIHGTTEYRLRPDLAEVNPDLFRNFSTVAQELFND